MKFRASGHITERVPLHQVTLRDWLIFLFLCITWGSSFILIKKALIGFNPVELATLRISISALAFVPVYILLVKEHIPRAKLRYVVFAALLGNGIPSFLYSFAQTHIASSVAGILNSLTPVFTWTIGMLVFASIFRWRHMAGISLGLIGAAAIVLLNHRFQFEFDAFALLVILATICYGTSVNIVKTYLQEVHPVAISAVALFIIGIPAFGYTLTTDIYTSIIHDSTVRMSLLAVTALALFSTSLATILFYHLVQRTNAVFASSVAYLIPVTALLWGLVDGEFLAATHIIGMGLILAGVYLLRK